IAPDDEAGDARSRRRAFAAFALVLGWQVLAGFIQCVYACLLAYVLWILVRVFLRPGVPGEFKVRVLAGFGLACAAGLAMGLASLLPLVERAQFSDRAHGKSWEFATFPPYWPRAALNFFFPYVNGDISNATYRGTDLFWESYGYVGLAAMFLAG